MSKAHTFKFKLLKNNVVKLDCNDQSLILETTESDELLTQVIEKSNNNSNIINFPRKVN